MGEGTRCCGGEGYRVAGGGGRSSYESLRTSGASESAKRTGRAEAGRPFDKLSERSIGVRKADRVSG